jgi:PAS domain S-box-containing protein
MLKDLKIRTKLFLIICTLALVGFGAVIAVVSSKSTRMAEQSADEVAANLAGKLAAESSEDLNAGLVTVKGLADIFAVMQENGSTSRESFAQVLKKIITENENYLSVWAIWEPNVVDGKDKQFVNKRHSNEKGRFVPAWYRKNNAIMTSPTPESDCNSSFYQLPKNSMKPAIIDPYLYSYDQNSANQIYVTSVVAPIIKNGKFMGVIGIDIDFRQIQKIVDTMKPYKTGYVYLMANEGMICAHPDIKQVGKKIDTVLSEINTNYKIIDYIKDGKTLSFTTKSRKTGLTSLYFHAPIHFKMTDTHWAMGVVVPLDTLKETSYIILYYSLIIGLIALALFVFASFLIAKNISDIIQKVTRQIKVLTDAAIREDFNVRGTPSEVNSEFRGIIEGINGTLDVVVAKTYWYEQILDSIPFAISVTDMDMNWTFTNKAAVSVIGKTRQESVGKQCNHWNINLCKNENCSIEQLRKGNPLTFFNQISTNKNFQINTTFLLNKDGERIGHIGVIQDITKGKQSEEYIKVEIARLSENLKKLSRGDLNFDMNMLQANEYTKLEYDNFTIMNQALLQARNGIRSLLDDTNLLTRSAKEGKLSMRADIAKHEGEFRAIVEGLNFTLDAIISPLNVAADYVDRISKGVIPQPITEVYQGDFNTLKNNLNRCVNTLQMMVTEMENTYQAQKAGDIEFFADATKFEGSYKSFIEGYNEGMAIHINNILEILGLLEQYAKGDFTPTLRVLPGKQVLANQIIDTVRYNLLSVIGDLNLLTESAIKGKLGARADASKHAGDFKKIIDGFNATLDGVTKPLQVAALNIEKLSIGEIPMIIAESFHGDFDLLKNNVNQLITATKQSTEHAMNIANGNLNIQVAERSANDQLMQAFIKCIGSLQKIVAAVKQFIELARKGEMDHISFNENEFQGAFREILGGLNNVANVTTEPLSEITHSLSNFAKGNLKITVDGTYYGIFKQLQETTNSLIRVNREIVEKAKLIAGGDLTLQIQRRSEDDELLQALKDMVEAISFVISEVKTATENVATSSGEMSQTSLQMSQGASEQASSSEEVSSSIEEMVANIHQNAQNASETEKIALKAAGDIEESSKAVQITVESMRNIAEKISIIGEIARKTDLLAINAAIEAARAGEHGKGFAVVAAEVRKLAERSQVAANEIDEVSRNSVSVAENSGRLLGKVVPDIQRTAYLVQEINASSLEQNTGANQINNAIQQLNLVTQQNAASAEEMATGSEEMASQAQMLKEVIGFFKTKDDQNRKISEKKQVQTKLAFKPKNTKPGAVKQTYPINPDFDALLEEGYERM